MLYKIYNSLSFSLLNSILFFMYFTIINKFPFLSKYDDVSRNTTYLKYADDYSEIASIAKKNKS